jgi:hypothetical protein
MELIGIDTAPLVEAIAADEAQHELEISERYGNLATAGYSIPMAWWCAVERSNRVVDDIPRYSSGEHGAHALPGRPGPIRNQRETKLTLA